MMQPESAPVIVAGQFDLDRLRFILHSAVDCTCGFKLHDDLAIALGNCAVGFLFSSSSPNTF